MMVISLLMFLREFLLRCRRPGFCIITGTFSPPDQGCQQGQHLIKIKMDGAIGRRVPKIGDPPSRPIHILLKSNYFLIPAGIGRQLRLSGPGSNDLLFGGALLQAIASTTGSNATGRMNFIAIN
jgi:hypothetical protein